jgi:hypothetical protein
MKGGFVKRLVLISLLASMLIMPSIASAFQLDMVPYVQFLPISIHGEEDVKPLGAIGARFEAKDIFKDFEFYVTMEAGKIDSGSFGKASDQEIWQRCQYGCSPTDLVNKWIDAKEYFGLMFGIQYRIRLME